MKNRKGKNKFRTVRSTVHENQQKLHIFVEHNGGFNLNMVSFVSAIGMIRDSTSPI